MITLDTVAAFLWCWNHIFFLETEEEGNFLWSDPDYSDGDNTIRPYGGTLKDYFFEAGIPCVRDKGRHCIVDYCGKDVKFINCDN